MERRTLRTTAMHASGDHDHENIVHCRHSHIHATCLETHAPLFAMPAGMMVMPSHAACVRGTCAALCLHSRTFPGLYTKWDAGPPLSCACLS